MSEPLTLTAPSIKVAERLARQYTVNQLAVAVLTDQRPPAPPTAAQLEPNATRSPSGITTADYLKLYRLHADATLAGVEARVQGNLPRAAYLDRRAAELYAAMQAAQEALQDALRPRILPGHPTQFRFKLPALTFTHPQYGPHAHTLPHIGTVDIAGLEGDDLALFTAFYREYPARDGTRWPLYAPCARDGLRPVKNLPGSDDARLILERLLFTHPGSVPVVKPTEFTETALNIPA